MASPVHSRSHSDSALSSTTDLWSQHKQSADLSSTLGMKHGVSDGSFLQAKQLEFLQKQMVQQISGLKVDKLSSLSIGDYDVSQNVVVLRQLKGKIWSHCGNTIDNKMLLYPEEAYFLMDMSVLRVYLAGCPLSLQEASQYFFRDAWCTLNHCLVYGYLSRLGYIIRRMPQANHMASTEENLMLPAHKRKLSCELNEPKPKSVKSVEEPDIESESSMLDRVSGDTCVLSENSGMNEVFPCPTVPKDCQLSTSKDFDYSNIEFPASGGMRVKSNASTCSDDFLPATESSTTSDLEHHFDYFSLLDFRETKRVTRTTSWPDFKLAHKTRLEKLHSPHSNDRPLVTPNIPSLDSVANVLDCLRLSCTETMKSLAKTVNNENNQLVFDVYQPTPNFRKSDPGKPLFRALVIEADDEFPSLASLCSLTSTEDDVPFYYAICDCGDITFFSHMQENIKPDLYDSRKRNKNNVT